VPELPSSTSSLSSSVDDDNKDEMEKDPMHQMSGVGTLRYMAPEVLLRQGYNLKADVYSFSMLVLYELLFHQKPFELYSLEMLQFWVGHEEERPVIPSTCPPHLQEWLKASWDATPRNRPTWTNSSVGWWSSPNHPLTRRRKHPRRCGPDFPGHRV
jgi:serine/threonine protein kinase